VTGRISHSVRKSSAGGVLIEFAFVLPIFLVLLLGTIYYGYVFALDSALEHATAEAAQAIAGLDATQLGGGCAEFETEAATLAREVATENLQNTWIAASVQGNFDFDAITVVYCGQEPLVTITVPLDVTGGSSPLLPQATLPIVGDVPPVPAQVQGVAQVTV